jgi:hypothetical protein
MNSSYSTKISFIILMLCWGLTYSARAFFFSGPVQTRDWIIPGPGGYYGFSETILNYTNAPTTTIHLGHYQTHVQQPIKVVASCCGVVVALVLAFLAVLTLRLLSARRENEGA